jgi:hypothetical protein
MVIEGECRVSDIAEFQHRGHLSPETYGRHACTDRFVDGKRSVSVRQVDADVDERQRQTPDEVCRL